MGGGVGAGGGILDFGFSILDLGARVVNGTSSTATYHRDALSLALEAPQFSEDASAAIREREVALGITFPDSVREWYSLDDAVGRLERYSNSDHAVPINELGTPFGDWYGGGPRDFVAEGLLLFMQENQGVCNWAFKLDGEPDPAVVVEVDTAPDAAWLPCADQFSTFVRCQVWDRRPDYATGVAAQEEELSRFDLAYLRSHFREMPVTCGWPGHTNYRFENEHGGILIWDGGADRGVDWSIGSRSSSELHALLTQIWRCGKLSKSLYGNQADADSILELLRAEMPQQRFLGHRSQ